MTLVSNAFDVLVLGGGPAGAAAAMLLARAGRDVALIERDKQAKHKVCGEFLSAEALSFLQVLGVDTEQHGSVPVKAVRLASGRDVVEAPLPFPARSLTRRCLDEVLLRCAANSGVRLLRGRTVEALVHERRWQVALDGHERVEARHVVLATGKHDLRGYPRPPGRQGNLLALKMYFDLAPAQHEALVGTVELLLHPAGYTGLQLVEGGGANLCALVQQQRLARLGGWKGLVEELKKRNEHAATRLHGAVAQLSKPLALSAIPYGFVREKALGTGLFAVGDQAAVIPSFTGDGMSLALYTGLAAARAILRGEPAQQFQSGVFAALRVQVLRATVLSRALVHPVAQPVLAAGARLWPGSLQQIARTTRVSARNYETLVEFARSV